MKKSTKNILISHSSNDLYGASKVLISTIEILISNGYNVHLILPSNGPLNFNKTIKKVNLSIVNLGVFRKKYFNILGLLTRLFFILKSTLFIKKYIKKNKIELVYINTSTIISPCISSFITQVPSVYHIHEIPIGSKIYLKFLIRIFNKFSNKVVVVSNAVKDFWVSNGLFENKVNVIYNGYDFDFSPYLTKNNDKSIFLSISRVIPYKGHAFMIELFREILKNRDDLILQIVGGTLPVYQPYVNKLKSKVKNYNIDNNILFLGFVPEIKSVLRKADFFIHVPVDPDPAPAVILEAIESGTPIIYSDNGGAREILNNGKNGLQIDLNSIQKSSKLILDYMSKNDIHKTKVENSIEFVAKHFNKDLYETKLINLLSQF